MTMKYSCIALLLIAASACKKSKTADSEIVDQFVKDVKAERYRKITLPAFNASHIEALMQHASDGQIVSHYPRPPHSSYLGPPMEVGFVMLYAIEAARLQIDWPSLFVRVFDEDDLERQVPLSEVLAYYKDWWAANKGKSAAELKMIDPLEGSGLTWQIYTTAE